MAKIVCRMKELPLKSIDASGRAREDFQDLSTLKQSILDEGLIHPIAVMEQGNFFVLLAGGRRLQAMTELGWETIPCNVYPPLDPLDQRTIELKENMLRENLTPIEEAKLTKKIHDLQVEKYGKPSAMNPGHRLQDTAKLIGRGVSTVQQDIKLAEMAEMVPELTLCKTKQEAMKMIDRATRAVQTAKAVEEFESKTGLGMYQADKERLLKSYYVGDFFDLVKKIPDGTVGFIELDPVYHIGLDKLKKGISFDQAYAEGAFADYEGFMQRVLKECVRVMCPNAWLICWYSIRYHHETTARTLEAAGLNVNRLPNIWNKHYGQTLQPEFNLPSCYDTFFSCRKGMPSLQKQGRSNIFDCKPVVSTSKTHPIERPIQLNQDILATFVAPGTSVLVPFAGSGNMLLAAANLHMPAIGFDLVQDYCNEFKLKAQGGLPGFYMSNLIGGAFDAVAIPSNY